MLFQVPVEKRAPDFYEGGLVAGSAENYTILQYAIGAAAVVGSFVGGVFMTVIGLKPRLRSSDDETLVTKYELMVAISAAKEEGRRERHELVAQLQRNTADTELDFDRINTNITEGARAIDKRLRDLEVAIARMQPRIRPAE